MTEFQKSVRTFMNHGGYHLPAHPAIPSLDMRKLCASLILEEALETIQGLGLTPCIALAASAFGIALTGQSAPEIEFQIFGPSDLVAFADGCADTSYVINFAASACGIDLEPVEREVCRSNLTKFNWTDAELAQAEADGLTVKRIQQQDGQWLAVVRNAIGKIQKPPSYSPAQIRPILEAQEQ